MIKWQQYFDKIVKQYCQKSHKNNAFKLKLNKVLVSWKATPPCCHLQLLLHFYSLLNFVFKSFFHFISFLSTFFTLLFSSLPLVSLHSITAQWVAITDNVVSSSFYLFFLHFNSNGCCCILRKETKETWQKMTKSGAKKSAEQWRRLTSSTSFSTVEVSIVFFLFLFFPLFYPNGVQVLI